MARRLGMANEADQRGRLYAPAANGQGHAMPLARRLIMIACWAAILAAYVAAILPQAEAPHLGGSDKLDHMAAFFTITILARLGYWRPTTGWLFLLAVAFGGLIELTQAIPLIHRDAEFGDWIADAVASAIGLTFATPILAWWRRRTGWDSNPR